MLLASIILSAGGLLTIGGLFLVTLGGSPLHAAVGSATALSGVLLFRQRALGGIIYGAVLIALTVWAVCEVGFDFWLLLPFLAGPVVLGGWLAMPWMWHQLAQSSELRFPLEPLLRFVPGAGALAALALGMAAGGGIATAPVGVMPQPVSSAGASDWPVVGNSARGTRFTPVSQITPDNVQSLTKVWEYRTGDLAERFPGSRSARMFEATPLKIGSRLYLCTPRNIVIALDADSGQELWRHDPEVDAEGVPMLICRGVTYFEAPADYAGECRQRILTATIDARMIALDAQTGERCQTFGSGGEISLKDGMGEIRPGYYYVTSPPTIIRGKAVVGGFVLDNMAIDEPSGVVRAFDALTGELAWSWDAGAPDEAAARDVTAGYRRGSPNAWTLFSADEDLGLVYVPTGNPTPDHYGGHRNAEIDRFSASVVALDGATGGLRWSFQTVHHDLWDYDVASQPVLVDLPVGANTVPALLQPTKHGEIFLLDRRTGKPLAPVEERPVPTGDVPGEKYAPTQPGVQGALSFTPPVLTEANMWGVTPLDQLWCRIQFRKLRYEGKFTPPSTQATLVYPGNNGIMNWGSVSVDEARHIMVVNSSYMPLIATLVPRSAAPDTDQIVVDGNAAISPMAGTPYAVRTERPFTSPLGIPCNAPPWGRLSAIGLVEQRLLWQRSLGTTRDHAPLNIPVPGVFNQGGTIITGSGLVFVGATLDNYLRAFDLATGKELWKGRLPAGGQATPMSYVSEKTGRQYVVIAAGGHQFMRTALSDYVVAYALPDGK